MRKYQAIVIGASAGGISAYKCLLPYFPKTYPLPIIIVQHLHPHQSTLWTQQFQYNLPVKVAQDKEPIHAGNIYFAPPNYHLLIEDSRTFALSIDPRVNYSRPAIDVLFESAANVYKKTLIGIVLTGANNDGAKGLKRIKEKRGIAIVENPDTAEISVMPQAAMEMVKVDYKLSLDEIGKLLVSDEVMRSRLIL